MTGEAIEHILQPFLTLLLILRAKLELCAEVFVAIKRQLRCLKFYFCVLKIRS